MAEIDSAYDFDPGYPHNFICVDPKRPATGPQDVAALGSLGHFDHVEAPKPIKPHVDDAAAEAKV